MLGKPLFEMCCFHIGIAEIALDTPPPSVKDKKLPIWMCKKSAANHPKENIVCGGEEKHRRKMDNTIWRRKMSFCGGEEKRRRKRRKNIWGQQLFFLEEKKNGV